MKNVEITTIRRINTLANNKHNWNSRVACLALTALLGFSMSAQAQGPERRGKVELHSQLSTLLEDISKLEKKIGNIPTTKKQRKRLNSSITQMRRKISRLMAVTPALVRRFDADAKQRRTQAVSPTVQVIPQKAKPIAAPPRIQAVPPTVQVIPQKAKPVPKPKGPKAMGKKAFASLMSAVESESFANGRRQVVKSAAPHRHFTIKQVVRLLGKFSFSGEKLKIVRILYPKVVDPKNAFKLYNVFSFESDKRKLRAILDN